jgi:hypothetical protein
MSIVSPLRVLLAGLAGGAALNAIDTPWSVFIMVPRMQAFLDAHHLSSSALTGPWFLVTHFAYMTLIAWSYALACRQFQPGPGLALAVSAVFLLINRAFGIGNVLIGIIPLDIFAGFSVSMAIGTLAGGVMAAKVIDRGSPQLASA